MLAARPAAPSRSPQPAPLPIDPEPALHVATDLDGPAPSPVQLLQARLEQELAIKRERFDLTWLAILLFSGACWWAVIALGIALMRGWAG